MYLILQTCGVIATLLPVAQKATTVTAHRMGVDIPTGLGYEKHCRLQEATGQICLFLTESSWLDKNKSFYCHLLAKGYQEPRNVHWWPVNGSELRKTKSVGAQHPREPHWPSGRYSQRDRTAPKWSMPDPAKHIQNNAVFKHQAKQKGWWWLVDRKP